MAGIQVSGLVSSSSFDWKEIVDKLMDDASRGSNAIIEVDLEKQEIKGPDGGTVRFEIDPFRKKCLMEGLDDIGLVQGLARGARDRQRGCGQRRRIQMMRA